MKSAAKPLHARATSGMFPCLHQEEGRSGAGGRTGVSAGIDGNAGRSGKREGWPAMGVVGRGMNRKDSLHAAAQGTVPL
jgi:hypothetical protein